MLIDQYVERLTRFDTNTALVWWGKSFSYRWLGDAIQDAQARLAECGVTEGDIVGVEGELTPATCAWLLALLQRQAIVVPLSIELPHTRRRVALDIAEADKGFRWGTSSDPTFWQRATRATHPLVDQLRTAGHGGLVLFTTGSTGEPKAVLHDVERLMPKFLAAEKAFRTVAFFLFDHMAGVDTLWYVLGSGATLLGCHDRSPDGISQLVAEHRAEVLPASPTFLTLLLLSEAYRRHDLSSLQIIAYGSEPMPDSTLARLEDELPHVRFIQKYGMCEIGSPRSKTKEEDSLWIKISGDNLHTKVVDGTLWVKADTAMLGYLNAPSPFDDDGWLNTEDQVLEDGDYVRVLGRKSDIINVGGAKVYPAEVESVLQEVDHVTSATVTGEAHPIMGEIVVAKLSLDQPEDVTSLKRRVYDACRDRLARYQMPVKIDVVEEPALDRRFKKAKE